jgi:hypothetical protein
VAAVEGAAEVPVEAVDCGEASCELPGWELAAVSGALGTRPPAGVA